MKYCIFDIDNCISDDQWRMEKIDWSQADLNKRYAAYHAACIHDEPRNKKLLRQYMKERVTPIFFTARPMAFRRETFRWFSSNIGFLFYIFQFHMRKDSDIRESVEIKRDFLRDFLKTVVISDIVAAFDDREDIIEMYKETGIVNAQILKIHDQCAMTPPPFQLPRPKV